MSARAYLLLTRMVAEVQGDFSNKITFCTFCHGRRLRGRDDYAHDPDCYYLEALAALAEAAEEDAGSNVVWLDSRRDR